MTITKDQMARDLAEKSGYYLKDVKVLLAAMDDYVKEVFAEVADDEDVSLQIVEGVKIGCSIQKERQRVDPRNQKPIWVKPTCKPNAKFSDVFRATIQKNYERKKSKDA